MFEKEAVEKGKYYDWNCNIDNTQAERIWKDGAEFGYNKALEEQGVKIESAYREGVDFGKYKLIEQMKCCANCMFSESDRLNGTFCHKEGCYVLASGKCNLWEF